MRRASFSQFLCGPCLTAAMMAVPLAQIVGIGMWLLLTGYVPDGAQLSSTAALGRGGAGDETCFAASTHAVDPQGWTPTCR